MLGLSIIALLVTFILSYRKEIDEIEREEQEQNEKEQIERINDENNYEIQKQKEQDNQHISDNNNIDSNLQNLENPNKNLVVLNNSKNLDKEKETTALDHSQNKTDMSILNPANAKNE